jgi:hypothetical protein
MAKKPDTSEYSATKAPETRTHAEERDSQTDTRLIPGGERGTPTPQGMAGLDRDDVPSGAEDSGQTRYRDTGRPETTGGGR